MCEIFVTETSQLWQEYLEAEHTHNRETRMLILDRFIDKLLMQKPEEWHAWALDLT